MQRLCGVMVASTGMAAAGDGSADADFALLESIPLTAECRRVLACDLDRDGWLDLAAVSESPPGVSVFFRDGLNGYGDALMVPVGGEEDPLGMDVASGDFDGDGLPDLAVLTTKRSDGSNGRSVRLLLNDGDRGFDEVADADAPDRASYLAAGDFDGSGRSGVVLSSVIDNRLQILRLDAGNRAVVDVELDPFVAAGAAPAIADVDSDGRDEIMIGLGIADWIPGDDGGPAWGSRFLTVPGLGSFFGAAFGDMNGDRSPDIALIRSQNATARRTVLLNDGAGTFTPVQPAPEFINSDPALPFLGDVDSDGRIDFLMREPDSGNIRIDLGLGDGTLAPGWAIAGGVLGPGNPIVVADLDGDGFSEIIGPGQDRENSTNVIVIAKGRVSGRPGAPLRPGLFNNGLLGIGDIDGDGTPDLAVSGGNWGLSSLMNDGGAFRTRSEIFPAMFGVRDGSVADIDGDGLDEILTISTNDDGLVVSGFVFEGLLGRETTYPLGPEPRAVATTDLNRDGLADVIVHDETEESISVLLGLPNGVLAPRVVTTGLPRGVPDLLLGDIDLDGDDDLVCSYQVGDDVVVLRNDDGVFTVFDVFELGNQHSASFLIDADGDGDPDLFAGIGSSAVELGFYLNDGTGRFADGVVPFDEGPLLGPIGATDLTGDGREELVVWAEFGLMGFDLTTDPPSRVFSRAVPGIIEGELFRADLDGDGDLEVIVGEDERSFEDLPVAIIESLESDPRPCGPADLAFPFGVIDLGDVAQFIGLFILGERSADLVPPFEVLDLGDIAAFLDAFAAECPNSEVD